MSPAAALISSIGPVGDDRSGLDQHDAAGERVGLLEVMGGEQDRAARVGVGADRVPDRAPGLLVEPRRRLVEDDEPRGARERERDGDPAALAAGETSQLARRASRST